MIVLALVLLVVILALLDVAALRWGVDSRDQSTGLPKNVVVYDEPGQSTRFVARQAAPQSPASSAAAQRDRAIWRLTDLRDQSTGFPK